MNKMNLLRLMAFAMLAVLSMGFVSCGDDDDAPKNDNQLIGTWIETYCNEICYERSNGKWVVIDEYEDVYEEERYGHGSSGMIFKSDGTMQFLEDLHFDGTFSYSDGDYGYKLNKGYLYLYASDEWGEYGKISIHRNTFELSWDEIEGDRRYVGKSIYQKIK